MQKSPNNLSHRSAIRFSLRTALFIAGAFSIFLTIYFAVSYLSIKNSLIARSDAEVYEQTDSILASLRSPGDDRNFLRLASLHNSTGETSIGYKLTRAENPSVKIQSVGLPRLRSVLDSRTFFVSELPIEIKVGENTIRVVERSNKVFTVFAAINTIAFQEVFDAMLRTYLLLLITGIAFSFVIGMFTARLALKPLKILVDSARSIKDNSEGSQPELPADTNTQEINELASVINDILHARDRNIAALRDFTADAAHELRTPLTILKGEFEVDLRTKQLSGNEKEAIESNLEEVQRLIKIVEDLLILARAEQASLQEDEKNITEWKIGEFLRYLVERLKSLIDEKGLAINTDLKADGIIRLPQYGVERIVYNILLNAIQNSDDQNPIEIITEEGSGGELHLSVIDHGIGISPEQIEYIFDRFWRADVSRSRSHGGTGLGLTIAKKFADSFEIKLHCESVSGKGTTMECIFPASVFIKEQRV